MAHSVAKLVKFRTSTQIMTIETDSNFTVTQIKYFKIL